MVKRRAVAALGDSMVSDAHGCMDAPLGRRRETGMQTEFKFELLSPTSVSVSPTRRRRERGMQTVIQPGHLGSGFADC